MNCETLHAKLSSYCLGDLSGPERAEVAAHLEQCEGCRAERKEVEQTLDLLRDALAAPSSIAGPVVERLTPERRARIFEKGPARKPVRILRWFTVPHPQTVALAAACLVVVLFVGGVSMSLLSRSCTAAYRVPTGSGIPSAASPRELQFCLEQTPDKLTVNGVPQTKKKKPVPKMYKLAPAAESPDDDVSALQEGGLKYDQFDDASGRRPNYAVNARSGKMGQGGGKTGGWPTLAGALADAEAKHKEERRKEVSERSIGGGEEANADVTYKTENYAISRGEGRMGMGGAAPSRGTPEGTMSAAPAPERSQPAERDVAVMFCIPPVNEGKVLKEPLRETERGGERGLAGPPVQRPATPPPPPAAPSPPTPRLSLSADAAAGGARRGTASGPEKSGIKADGSGYVDTRRFLQVAKAEAAPPADGAPASAAANAGTRAEKFAILPETEATEANNRPRTTFTQSEAPRPSETFTRAEKKGDKDIVAEVRKQTDDLGIAGGRRVSAIDERRIIGDAFDKQETTGPAPRPVTAAGEAGSIRGFLMSTNPREVDPLPPKFKAFGVNPYVEAATQPFSTFSIDVDTASYTVSRNYMLRGQRPPAEAVRTEEFVNFFDYAYAAPSKETFRVYAELAPSKFGHGRQLLKIGIKGKRLGREEQRGAVLTFLVDTSGSMDKPDRIGLIRKSLKILLERLGPQDQVAIVQFGSNARLILDHTPASEKAKILAAIDALQCSGSTNLEEGMLRAYAAAAASFRPKGENRVLILSDGVANLGAVAAEDILGKVEAYRKQGIYCSVFGFGIGTFDDTMLESLANKGNGAYAFVDSEAEAKRLFVEDLAATLNTIAADVKIQVEFNPRVVAKYRQLGYENRQLKKEDFRNDAVDAGEVGSGQSVTALYEVELKPETRGAIATVRVRYCRTDTGKVEELERPVTAADLKASFDQADVRFRLAACVAEFAEKLRGSPHAAGTDFPDVAAAMEPVALELKLDPRVQELLGLMRSAASLSMSGESR